MDPRRYSVPNDAASYPTGFEPNAYTPGRSVYRKAKDPSQSFTRRSGGNAPAGGESTAAQDPQRDRRVPPQVYGPPKPSAEWSEPSSRRRPQTQGPGYFTNHALDSAEMPPPPEPHYTAPTTRRAPDVIDTQSFRPWPASQPYPPPVRTQPNEYKSYVPHGEYEGSPVSPDATTRKISGASASSSTRRRGSVPHRSPLQKLEGKLDDISKEEKRARLEEAEHQAQQRAAAQRLNGVIYDPSNDSSPRRGSSQKNVDAASSRQPRQAGPDPRDIRKSLEGVSREPQGNLGPPINQRHDDSRVGRRDIPLHDTNYAADVRERVLPQDEKRVDPAMTRQQNRAYRDGYVAADEGLQETNNARAQNSHQTNTRDSTRSNSRKLQKKHPENYKTGQRDPNTMSDAHKQMQSDRMGSASKPATAPIYKHQEPDPVPRTEVRNESNQAPTYTVPPQTAASQHAREQVGLHSGEPQVYSDTAAGPQRHHHFSNFLHRRQDSQRRYEAPKPLEEWRQAGTARLIGSDIDLDEKDSREDRNKAWWEQGDSRRRSSQSYEDRYDRSQEEKDDRLSFNPPLYLRCGPLLRYTGMRREQSSRSSRHANGAREIWRGSVMIVTSDAHSSYDKTPTLRLFVQPRDLLPPPPAKVDVVSGQHLAPEYVDPIADLPKLSRTGKLVYVKPVEQLDEGVDYSCIEDNEGLFESVKRSQRANGNGTQDGQRASAQRRHDSRPKDGETLGRYREVKAARLHAERGVTFWRFNLEIELGSEQARVAYRINRGPAIGFWVPARGQTMNIMFHSCNGFSLSVDPNLFSGPDPLWRDVLNNHQTRPFHVMIGGGDQLYMDRATRDTQLFQEWLAIKNPEHKQAAQFTAEMQDELEDFYLNRYAMWFSQGLFGMANSQIPMINIWDDHDIIDVSK